MTSTTDSNFKTIDCLLTVAGAYLATLAASGGGDTASWTPYLRPDAQLPGLVAAVAAFVAFRRTPRRPDSAEVVTTDGTTAHVEKAVSQEPENGNEGFAAEPLLAPAANNGTVNSSDMAPERSLRLQPLVDGEGNVIGARDPAGMVWRQASPRRTNKARPAGTSAPAPAAVAEPSAVPIPRVGGGSVVFEGQANGLGTGGTP